MNIRYPFCNAITLAICLLNIPLSDQSAAVAASISIDNTAVTGELNDFTPDGFIRILEDFTVPDKPNRVLVVTVAGQMNKGLGIFGIKWGTQRFTEAVDFHRWGNTNIRAGIFYLLNPDPGTKDIVYNRDTVQGGWSFSAMALSNVRQEAPETDRDRDSVELPTIDEGDPNWDPLLHDPDFGLSNTVITVADNSLLIEALSRSGDNEALVLPAGPAPNFFLNEPDLVFDGTSYGATSVIPTAGAITRDWGVPAGNDTLNYSALVSAAFAPAESTDSADFDGDLDVDGADFLMWQRGFETNGDGDADGDGDSDIDDLTIWELQFGSTINPLGAASGVPEPTSWILGAIGLTVLGRQRR